MFIVVFQNTDDIDFMKWSFGPYYTTEEAEQARLKFIDEMDQIDEFSSVWAGDVLQLVPFDQAVTLMGNSLREDMEGN